MSDKPTPKSGKKKVLPDWSHAFLTTIDGRSELGYALRKRHEALQEHVSGGNPEKLTYPLWLEARIESDEEGFAIGNPLPPGAHATLLNSLVSIYKLLGIEPKVKSVPTLRDYMRSKRD